MTLRRRAPWECLLLVLAAGCGGGAGGAASDGGSDAGRTDASADGSGQDGRSDGTTSDASGDGAPSPCGAITTFETGKTPSLVIHIAASGNDATGDGTLAKPFATLDKAFGVAKPGTALRLHAGTYAGGGYAEKLFGTADAPIWIGGAPGEARPLIMGGGAAFQVSQSRYVIVHDLEVVGATGNGINFDDGGDFANENAARHIVFRNLSIHNIGAGGNQDCLKLSGLNDFFVLDSEIARCGGGGSGIDHVGCHRGLIARNHFHDLTSNAVQTKGGSADIEIRANRFIACGQRALNLGGSTDLALFRPPLSMSGSNAEARAIRAIANVIRGGMTPLAFVGCVGCLAANNTLVDFERWPMRILQETTTGGGFTFEPSGKSTVTNNIFYFERAAVSSEFVNVGGGTDAPSFVFSNNLWYAHDAPGMSMPKLPTVEADGVVGTDPTFAAPASDDYAISASSPAAGQGKANAAVIADAAGACYRTPPAIGAYEVR